MEHWSGSYTMTEEKLVAKVPIVGSNNRENHIIKIFESQQIKTKFKEVEGGNEQKEMHWFKLQNVVLNKNEARKDPQI